MKDYQKEYRKNMTDKQKQRYKKNITDKQKQYKKIKPMIQLGNMIKLERSQLEKEIITRLDIY